MNTGIGLQAILRFSVRNLTGCNVGMTEGVFINYAVEMVFGVMIYSVFTKFLQGFEKLWRANKLSWSYAVCGRS
jgi:hypothetical protein